MSDTTANNTSTPDPEAMEVAIAGEEVENWIEVETENGVTEKYLVIDILDIEYKGQENSYAILLSEEEAEKEEVENPIIAKWINSGETAELHPLESVEESQFITESVQAFYEAEANGEEVAVVTD